MNPGIFLILNFPSNISESWETNGFFINIPSGQNHLRIYCTWSTKLTAAFLIQGFPAVPQKTLYEPQTRRLTMTNNFIDRLMEKNHSKYRHDHFPQTNYLNVHQISKLLLTFNRTFFPSPMLHLNPDSVHITHWIKCNTWFARLPSPIRKLSGLMSLWRKLFECTYSTLLICKRYGNNRQYTLLCWSSQPVGY